MCSYGFDQMSKKRMKMVLRSMGYNKYTGHVEISAWWIADVWSFSKDSWFICSSISWSQIQLHQLHHLQLYLRDYHSWGQWCIATFKVQKCKSMLVSGHYCGMGIIKHCLIEISSRWLQFYCRKTITQLQKKRVQRHDIIKAAASESGERLLVFETQPQVSEHRCFAGGSDQTPSSLNMIKNLQSTVFL